MPSTPRGPGRFALIAAATALAATACTSGAAEAPTEADGGWEAVTVEHALGSTEITAEPERVVTIGWSDEATALSLGVVPVGMAASTFAGDDEGYLPWDLEKIEELGGEKPELFNTDDGIPVEEIAALEPDLVLGVQSGITQNEYDQLSAVAPTIAYAEQPYMTTWQDATTMIGDALGRPEEAGSVIDDTEAYLSGIAEEYPEFEGTTFTAGTQMPDTSEFAFYVDGDARPMLMSRIGFEPAPFIDGIEAEEGAFNVRMSQEEADRIETDVLVMWYNTPEHREDVEGSEVFQKVGAVQDGSYIAYDDPARSMAVSSPNPLTIPWVMDDVAADLAKAVAGEA